MNFKPGKLYKVNSRFWLLPPVIVNHAHASFDAEVVVAWASYWSQVLDCDVPFLIEGDVFIVVDVLGSRMKVVDQEWKIGWIYFPAEESWTSGTITEVSSNGT